MNEPNEILEEFLESRAWQLVRKAALERIELHAGALVGCDPKSGEEAWAILKAQQAVIGELTQLVDSPRSYFTLTPPGSQ